MELISTAYRDLNKEAHVRYPTFGRTSGRYAPIVLEMIKRYKPSSVLDYGCGKGMLGHELRHRIMQEWREYDPCIEGKDAKPEPADLVICTDVLEHVEPEHLDAVLDDLRRVTRERVFFVIATRFASHQLADGRNAHLIVENDDWWLKRLSKQFKLIGGHGDERELTCLMS